MNTGLQLIRSQCTDPADAVRWACVLEATAPKVGNVSPGKPFADLCFADFVAAAEIASSAFDASPAVFSQAVLRACQQIAERIRTNVNLGILLLIGPLVQADATASPDRLSRKQWQRCVADLLPRLTADDSARLYAAINVALPGGMGQAAEMDLSGPAPDSFLAAMKTAQSRDRIARNYANEYSDLFEHIVPLLFSKIETCGDMLAGIAATHLQLLTEEPDTLIARKHGLHVARDVQDRSKIDPADPQQSADLDHFLRTGQRFNPGTTADLIAAALYILLREQ
ncbi:triphosphoribosyl-dephospho-CoA synthase [Stieleria sp. TO1_6]|uniref:triphosphoribosyl-dephospho-CoA synthase n=1 Tax=Stieleria tagensis TaxID=2956795 RepID=UPI00209A91D1|nr:triphosphoribosyl-dephospho-CoA synthase [Stieleria tagensis]MCO8122164.1 triphosphoribosyl-dephospho-CoA synthase [Stieleria tagensis]